MSQFDVKAIRNVYSQFPTGVTVITTVTESGEPIGVTASSFNTVSIDPPLILWSIDKNAYSLNTFQQCKHFAVNVLTEEQVDLSNRFAGRGEDKFQGVTFSLGQGDCPLLEGTLAQLVCSNWAVYEGGDHLILVGKVLDFHLSSESQRPLVFSQGSYAQAVPHAISTVATEEMSPHQQAFLDNHLLYLLRRTYNKHSNQLYRLFEEQLGISPEKWRVFASLSDGQTMSLDKLSELVMQPYDRLLDTLDSMDKSHLIIDNKQAQLTDKGQSISQQLLNIATQYDENLVTGIGQDNRQQFYQNLKLLCKA